MILGQIVAISFASSLFLALLHLPTIAGNNSATGVTATRSKQILAGAVGLALATVFVVPSTTASSSFLPNLLVMHAVIVLPLVKLAWERSATLDKASRRPAVPRSGSSPSFQQLYYAAAIVSLISHAKNSFALYPRVKSLQEFGQLLQATLKSHPAQQSISWDVICTNGIWQIWSWLEVYKFRSRGHIGNGQAFVAAIVIGFTPTFGSAVALAIFLGMREDWIARQRREAKKD